MDDLEKSGQKMMWA